MDGWTDGRMDGQMDGQKEGWTDRQTDGWMDRKMGWALVQVSLWKIYFCYICKKIMNFLSTFNNMHKIHDHSTYSYFILEGNFMLFSLKKSLFSP